MNSLANTPEAPAESRSRLAFLARHFPPGKFGRYLLVGGFNTLFGYGCYALLVAIIERRIPHGYILASVIAGVINITVAFLNYKLFVFKTKGGYLREWTRCVAVYGSALAINTLLLPVLVFAIRRWTHQNASAPYIAGAILTVSTVVYSFLGHKNFSFRESASETTRG